LNRRFGKSRIREAKVKGNVAGEAVRSEPLNETRVCFRPGGMGRIPEIDRNIP